MALYKSVKNMKKKELHLSLLLNSQILTASIIVIHSRDFLALTIYYKNLFRITVVMPDTRLYAEQQFLVQKNRSPENMD